MTGSLFRVRGIAKSSLICFCLLSVFSCSPQNRIEGYLYYRLNADPTTLDPALIVDVTGGMIAAKLFNGLVKIGEDLRVIPDIAGSWTISSDGLLYIFRLKRDVKFSNGRLVTAHDFKYSFERILNPKNKSPVTWVFEKILGSEEFMQGRTIEVQGIQVTDDNTLAIHLRDRSRRS
jgi:oligopeptide transport system substrate-binding protein